MEFLSKIGFVGWLTHSASGPLTSPQYM